MGARAGVGIAGIADGAVVGMAAEGREELAGIAEGGCIALVEALAEMGVAIARWCLLPSVQAAVQVFDSGSRSILG